MVGLLPQDDMAMNGLLGYDPEQLKRQAIMQAGLAMLANSGPSPVKQNLASIVGQGGLAGMQAYSQGRDQAIKNALLKRRMDAEDRRLAQGLDDPSSVREWEYYNALPPEKKREYLAMKRAAQIKNIGGVETVVDPVAPGASPNTPLSTLDDERVANETLNPPEGYRRTEDGRFVPVEGAPASSTLDKRLFDVNDAAFKARSNQEQYANLAEQMETVLPAAGQGAKWTESLKAITGDEDATTNLRKQWNNLRVSAAVQNLPPGVASDKDIELVMSAFLPEFANPEAVASFMRGLSKLEAIKGDYHEFEAEYLSKNRSPVGLNKAWRERLSQQQQANDEFAGFELVRQP